MKHAGTRGSGGMPPPPPGNLKKKMLNTAIWSHFHIKCIFLPVDILYTAFRYAWLSAAFANEKVWVGSDNQVHDAPSHNCVQDNVETGKF